jgi:hypothetical protein
MRQVVYLVACQAQQYFSSTFWRLRQPNRWRRALAAGGRRPCCRKGPVLARTSCPRRKCPAQVRAAQSTDLMIDSGDQVTPTTDTNGHGHCRTGKTEARQWHVQQPVQQPQRLHAPIRTICRPSTCTSDRYRPSCDEFTPRRSTRSVSYWDTALASDAHALAWMAESQRWPPRPRLAEPGRVDR